MKRILLLCMFALPVSAADFETITFKSKDGLEITADLYKKHKDVKTPFIVLCHQARWSRGEYREIAPKLNELGFNCMAIDQRSGGAVNGVNNETFQRAQKAGKATNYPDARPDIIAAVKFAKKKHAKGKVILWGSSYSSALVLQIAGSEKKLVDGVLSFAPREYFGRFGKPGNWITQAAKSIKCPAFITSAKREKPQWQAIYDAIPGKNKAFFLPEAEGQHGSRALWKQFPESGDYWKAVKDFLAKHFKTK